MRESCELKLLLGEVQILGRYLFVESVRLLSEEVLLWERVATYTNLVRLNLVAYRGRLGFHHYFVAVAHALQHVGSRKPYMSSSEG